MTSKWRPLNVNALGSSATSHERVLIVTDDVTLALRTEPGNEQTTLCLWRHEPDGTITQTLEISLWPDEQVEVAHALCESAANGQTTLLGPYLMPQHRTRARVAGEILSPILYELGLALEEPF